MNQKGAVISELEYTHSKDKIEMSLSPLPDGIYFLQITSEKGTTTKKVIKQ